jgi:hypothetical protein
MGHSYVQYCEKKKKIVEEEFEGVLYIKLNIMQVRGDTSCIYALGSTFIMFSPTKLRIQDNDNYKTHAKHYSNLSMFTEVIA